MQPECQFGTPSSSLSRHLLSKGKEITDFPLSVMGQMPTQNDIQRKLCDRTEIFSYPDHTRKGCGQNYRNVSKLEIFQAKILTGGGNRLFLLT